MVNERAKAAAKTVVNAGGKFIIIGALPAIASAYFTYKTAQIESQVKIAEAQAKVTMKAEAGYEVMVQKIDWLESRLAALEERPNHEAARPTTRRRSPPLPLGAGVGLLGGVGAGSGSSGASSGPTGSKIQAEAPLPRTLDEVVRKNERK